MKLANGEIQSDAKVVLASISWDTIVVFSRRSLMKLRAPEHDVEEEIVAIRQGLEQQNREHRSFCQQVGSSHVRCISHKREFFILYQPNSYKSQMCHFNLRL